MFVTSGSSLAVFGVWVDEVCHLGVQLCSIWGAVSHPVYNIRIQCCTFYSTGVQLYLRYVRLRSNFCHIYNIREQLLGL